MRTKNGYDWDAEGGDDVEIDVDEAARYIYLTVDDLVAMLQAMGHTYMPPADIDRPLTAAEVEAVGRATGEKV